MGIAGSVVASRSRNRDWRTSARQWGQRLAIESLNQVFEERDMAGDDDLHLGLTGGAIAMEAAEQLTHGGLVLGRKPVDWCALVAFGCMVRL